MNKKNNIDKEKRRVIILGGLFLVFVIVVLIFSSSKHAIIKESKNSYSFPQSGISDAKSANQHVASGKLKYTNIFKDIPIVIDTGVDKFLPVGEMSYMLQKDAYIYIGTYKDDINNECLVPIINALTSDASFDSITNVLKLSKSSSGYINGYNASSNFYAMNIPEKKGSYVKGALLLYDIDTQISDSHIVIAGITTTRTTDMLDRLNQFLIATIYTMTGDKTALDEQKKRDTAIDAKQQNVQNLDSAYAGKVEIKEPTEDNLTDEAEADKKSEAENTNDTNGYMTTKYVQIEPTTDTMYIMLNYPNVDVPSGFLLTSPDDTNTYKPVFMGVSQDKKSVSVFFEIKDPVKGIYSITIGDMRIGDCTISVLDNDVLLKNYSGDAFNGYTKPKEVEVETGIEINEISEPSKSGGE